MKSIRSLSVLIALAMMLAASMTAFAMSAEQVPRQQTNFADSLEISDTRASEPATPIAAPTPPGEVDQDAALRRACAEAADELRAARRLIETQQVEIGRYAEILRLETELRASLKRFGELSDQEKAELRSALEAKDRQVASLEAAIAALKRERPSIWKKFGWIVVGAGAGVVIGSVLNR